MDLTPKNYILIKYQLIQIKRINKICMIKLKISNYHNKRIVKLIKKEKIKNLDLIFNYTFE